jgi:hypothetical protein
MTHRQRRRLFIWALVAALLILALLGYVLRLPRPGATAAAATV